MRRLALAALAVAVGLGGCRDFTEVVVVVATRDLRVPADIDGFSLVVRDVTVGADQYAIGAPTPRPLCVTGADCTTLPTGISLTPGAMRPDDQIRVDVTAYKNGAPVIEDAALFRFHRGARERIDLVFSGNCVATRCAADGLACVDGSCQAITTTPLGSGPDFGGAGAPGDGGATPDGGTPGDGGAGPGCTAAMPLLVDNTSFVPNADVVDVAPIGGGEELVVWSSSAIPQATPNRVSVARVDVTNRTSVVLQPLVCTDECMAPRAGAATTSSPPIVGVLSVDGGSVHPTGVRYDRVGGTQLGSAGTTCSMNGIPQGGDVIGIPGVDQGYLLGCGDGEMLRGTAWQGSSSTSMSTFGREARLAPAAGGAWVAYVAPQAVGPAVMLTTVAADGSFGTTPGELLRAQSTPVGIGFDASLDGSRVLVALVDNGHILVGNGRVLPNNTGIAAATPDVRHPLSVALRTGTSQALVGYTDGTSGFVLPVDAAGGQLLGPPVKLTSMPSPPQLAWDDGLQRFVAAFLDLSNGRVVPLVTAVDCR